MNLIHKIKRKLLKLQNRDKDYFLFSYNSGGAFNYDQYRKIQEDGNKRKINSSWVQEDEIVFLSKKIRGIVPQPTFGICHGTRRGYEQKWFSEYLGCEAIGTEISETAKDFPNTVQWDFHEENPDWNKKADFVYSNSFDHSYDPGKALNAWLDSLKDHGACVIEHSHFHAPEAANELDPFGARLEIMPFLVLKWTNSMWSVREIWEYAYTDKNSGEHLTKNYLVIRKN